MVTTILETNTQVVTATEIRTSSLLVTPEPTWEVQTFTITPSPVLPQLLLSTSQPPALFLPQLSVSSPKKRNNQEAKVIEIGSEPTGNDFKSAYGAYFADSAQRSANRFADVLRPARNPLFSQQNFDYYEDFDQQGLSAQQSPVYLKSPPSQQKSKVFTLYFSGTAPGHFETKLTRLAVDDSGQPILTRNKREDISPSKVEPILSTEPPTLDNSVISAQQLESSSVDLESSVPTLALSTVTKTVTVTETLNQCSK